MDRDKLLKFLKSQELMVIASAGEDVWVTNVFYGIGDDFKVYFVSGTDTKHSEQIVKNPKIAFSVAWYDRNDHTDRKAIQGQGTCRIAETDQEIEEGIRLHNESFPEFKSRLTPDYIRSEENESLVWVIEPTYMKFWNDELYGEEEWEELEF